MEENDVGRIEDKLDQVLVILHGDGKNDMGVVQKVNFLWLVVLKWPLYIAGIITGAALTVVIQKFLQ